MYILVLLFGIVNCYFLLTTLIIFLGLFTEFVQIPLINYFAKTFSLPIHYSVKKTLVHYDAHIFNIIFNIDNNKLYNNDIDDTDNLDDIVGSDNVDADNVDADNVVDSADVADENINEDSDENSSIPDLIDENEFLYLKKSSAIIIDETLD